MPDITEIKSALAGREMAVVQDLFPNGKREGDEWRVGSVNGEPGKSMAIHLTGPKAGLWADVNGDTGGDLIDLWMAAKKRTLPEALEDLREYVGLPAPKVNRRRSYSDNRRPGNEMGHGRCCDPDGGPREQNERRQLGVGD